MQLTSLNVFASAYYESDFFGKLIFLALFSLSAICWVILIQKTIAARRARAIATVFKTNLSHCKERFLSIEAEQLTAQVSHPFARIFTHLKEKTLEILNKNLFFISQQKQENQNSVYLSQADLQLVEAHVHTAISVEMKRLEKNLFILSTIVTLAPFLGLLGTVWGILVTFAELHSGGSAGSNSAILGGLSTALATTVLGLVIAIPALISYNTLRNNLKVFASDMEDFLSSLLSTLELQYRKVDVE